MVLVVNSWVFIAMAWCIYLGHHIGGIIFGIIDTIMFPFNFFMSASFSFFIIPLFVTVYGNPSTVAQMAQQATRDRKVPCPHLDTMRLCFKIYGVFVLSTWIRRNALAHAATTAGWDLHVCIQFWFCIKGHARYSYFPPFTKSRLTYFIPLWLI